MTDRFTELKNSAQQSSQLIEAQLQSIESSLLGASVAVLISALISKTFSLLIFWIPASFLLMWSLLMLSFFRSIIPAGRRLRSRSRTKRSGNVQTVRSLSDTDHFLITTSFKNATPFFNTIGVIFLASLLSLLIYKIGLIGEGITFSIAIPLVSSLLFMPLPIVINITIAKLEKSKSRLDLTNMGCLASCLILGGAFAYILVLLAFPIWSLLILHPIYGMGLPSVLSLIVVIFLLAITALAFMNYFSASLVRKEMGIALFNLSNIQNRIEDLLSNQRTISDETYQELRDEYTKAKLYNMAVDDTLLVNYYSVRPNPAYLSKLDR